MRHRSCFPAALFIEAEVELVVVDAFTLAAHGNPRSTGDIGILTSLEGISDFSEAIESAIHAAIDDMVIPVPGGIVLIKNKRALGRPQDLADVAWLESR